MVECSMKAANILRVSATIAMLSFVVALMVDSTNVILVCYALFMLAMSAGIISLFFED